MKDDAQTRPVAGEVFGGYEIVEELGHGGMGLVFRARHLTLDRDVALKVLGSGLSADAGYRQRFLKEARSAARLNHRNIVQIYDFGQCGETAYLAMEFVPGRSLGDLLRMRGAFPEAQAVALCRQASTALGFAHTAGVVHRDVKPDNLILRDDGVLKLVDLGLAKSVSDDQGLTQTGVVAGTPHYISPEQIEGRKDIDGRADVYSLGATLFHLVTGHTPFEGSSPMVVIAKHLHDDPRDPRSFQPALSEALCAVILRMMARSRDDRYPDMASVDLELARLQNGEAPEQATLAGLETTVVVAGVDPAGSTLAVDSRFNPEELARVEAHLAEAIGPLARVLVKRTSAMTSDLGELCEALARHIPSPPVRERFLSSVLNRAATGMPPTATRDGSATSRSGPSQAEQPSTGEVSSGSIEWDPQSLQALEKRLAASIGPVARVLVAKTARRASSWRTLVGTLAESLSDPADRAAFQREFEQP